MTSHPLDNPIWSSLATRHASLGVVQGAAARYPTEVAPFAAVEHPGESAGESLCALVAPGESLYLVGIAPPLGSSWQVLQQTSIAQMICHECVEPKPGPQCRVLGVAEADDMLDLTARVFPGYFRSRTHEMGRYLGIYAGTTLAAMAGERLCPDGHVEISAVCTHPDFTSRGFAARLVAQLCSDIVARRLTPFLHVNRDNQRARALYEKLGFVDRASIGLWSVCRQREG